jgi:hypothetical protein
MPPCQHATEHVDYVRSPGWRCRLIAITGPGHMWAALRRWLLPRRAAAPPVAAMSDLQAMPIANMPLCQVANHTAAAGAVQQSVFFPQEAKLASQDLGKYLRRCGPMTDFGETWPPGCAGGLLRLKEVNLPGPYLS